MTNMSLKHLKYNGYSVVMQEVPDEISLAINITNCPYKCPDCHSKFLWEDNGELLLDNLEGLINIYKEYITCVCFMGGDQNGGELIAALKLCRRNNLKTCLYTGSDIINFELLEYLDYYKIGRFIKDRGGLKSKSTNQRMYLVDHSVDKPQLTDITNKFQTRYNYI